MELKDLSEMHIADMQKSWFRQFNVPYADDMKMYQARNIMLSRFKGYEINFPPTRYKFMSNDQFRIHEQECIKKNNPKIEKQKGDWQ